MRVSDSQLADIVKGELFRNAELLLKAEKRVATRKRISTPSDDPTGMGKVLDYRKTISSIDQYNNNIVSAKNRSEFTDTLLENLHELMSQAKRIAVEHSGGGTDAALRESAAQHVEGIYEQAFAIANTTFNGSYLFAGHQTNTQPFSECSAITCGGKADLTDGDYFTLDPGYYVWYDTDGFDDSDPAIAGSTGIRVDVSLSASAADVAGATIAAIDANPNFTATVSPDNLDKVEIVAVSGSYPDIVDVNTGFRTHDAKYVGDNGTINTIVGEGAQVRINLTGDEVFTGAAVNDGTNVFDDLKALKEALEAEPFDASAVSGLAENLAKGIDQVESAAVRQSTAYKRLETTETHWEKFKNSIVGLLSKTEDADLATAIVELQAQETAYEASLAAAAKMFNKKSLMDFLG